MGRRCTPEDDLKQMARRYPTPLIAQVMNRTVGGVTFKAHQLEVRLRARSKAEELTAGDDPRPAGFDWTELP